MSKSYLQLAMIARLLGGLLLLLNYLEELIMISRTTGTQG
uniref:Uncharacterized protein n=1 Tax=Rhizophora mucronata TaxID=61149 RepID=A0A2P2NYC9_RHIMU